MVTKKLFCLFPLLFLTLFFSSANHYINARAAGNIPPLSPPYEPGYIPYIKTAQHPMQARCLHWRLYVGNPNLEQRISIRCFHGSTQHLHRLR